MIIATALTCLALNVFHEARSEPLRGQLAVAFVTVNRAKWDEDKVCTETFKRKQFSWTSGVRKTEAGWVIPQHLYPRVGNPIERQAWHVAVKNARKVLTGSVNDFTKGSTHYHATWVNPSWGKQMRTAFVIGSHRFYFPEYVSQS